MDHLLIFYTHLLSDTEIITKYFDAKDEGRNPYLQVQWV